MSFPKKLVIKRHKPLHIFAVIVISCSVATTAIWVFLDESQWSYIKSGLFEAKKNKKLWQKNQVMDDTIIKLEKRIVMLERTVRLEKQTITNLQKEIIKRQDEVYDLKKELEFYQGIMASASEVRGLSVQGLRIEATSQPRSYYFNLILTHVSKSDTMVAGRLTILLEGVQGNIPKTIDIRELTLSRSLSLFFKINSFERIKGSITLPEGFVVHRVIVQARQEGKKTNPQIERIFNWTEAMTYQDVI